MDPISKLLTNIPSSKCFSKRSYNLNLSDAFKDLLSGIDSYKLFVTHFNCIPNYIHETHVDITKVNKWILQNFALEITNYYYVKNIFKGNKNSEYEQLYYFLFEDLMININLENDTIKLFFKQTPISKIDIILSGVKQKKSGEMFNSFYLIIQSARGLYLDRMRVKKPKLKIENNYNDDFIAINKIIQSTLSLENSKGLVLLHGKPGTGKTFYIRFLIASLKKKVIFMSPDLAEKITGPNLLSLLIDNPNSVLVIEDAENIITDRERIGNSPVSALLNVSDGLLSDCLNIQIICSFNTDLSKVDRALLRKGRLIAKYEFKDLEVKKAQQLSDKLGNNFIITKPMSLTSVYNLKDMEFNNKPVVSSIGFNSSYQKN